MSKQSILHDPPRIPHLSLRGIVRPRAVAVVLAAAALSLACGGGNGGGGDGGSAPAAVGSSDISQGPVTQFGSVYVNGVRWLISRARIIVDGEVGDEDDLRLGMIGMVKGELSDDGQTGRASSVEYDDDVQGPIEDDPETLPSGIEKRFRVLGREILMHRTKTRFDDGASFDGLEKDDVVEVSGLMDDRGRTRATRIEWKGDFRTDESEVEIEGIVENLQKNADGSGIFEIDEITVRYDASTEFDDLTRETLEEGIRVEVEGTLRASGDLDADEIEGEDDDDFEDDDREHAEITGFVTEFTDLDSLFKVAGVPVDGSDARLEPADLEVRNGLRVEVEGKIEEGVLIAREIELEDDDDDFICNDDFTDVSEGWRLDNVKVPENASCALAGAIVDGNVQAEEGGSRLVLLNSVVDGNVQVKEGFFVSIKGNTLDGNIQVKETLGDEFNEIEDNFLDGNIQVSENEAFFSIRNNFTEGNIQFEKNTGGGAIVDNQVEGNLQCFDNFPDPTVSGNTVGGDFECDD